MKRPYRPFTSGNFKKRERGGVSVQIAIMLVALLGFVALGTEIVFTLFKSREMQSATDSAALAAATARMRGYPVDYVTEALAVASASGFIAGQDGTTVTVNYPPASGGFQGKPEAVEVIISQPQTLAIVNLLRDGSVVVTARAVAVIGSSGRFCALSLDGAASGAVSGSGGATVDMIDCGLAVNSASDHAVSLSGGANITALQLSIVGGYSLSGGAFITATDGITTHAAPTSDPYANIPVPAFGACNKNNYSASGGKVETLSPGVYCNGMSLSGGSVITLNPGVYTIDRGSLSVSGNSSLSGNGVTIVLTSSTHSNYGTVSFSGGAIVNITAPSSGPTAGLAFFQDQAAPTSGSNNFSGGNAQVINGALYFPRQAIRYSGGSSTDGKCTQLIARTMSFTGNATLRLNCEGMGTSPIGAGATRLVE
jgi:hypothetical protein